MSLPDDRYLAYMGLAPARIPHWDQWSCPDAEAYLTGIDYYQHPRQCRLALQRNYPQLRLSVSESDDPIPRPELGLSGNPKQSSSISICLPRWPGAESASNCAAQPIVSGSAVLVSPQWVPKE